MGIWADGYRLSTKGLCSALGLPYERTANPDRVVSEALEMAMTSDIHGELYRLGKFSYFALSPTIRTIPVLDVHGVDPIEREVEELRDSGYLGSYRGIVTVASRDVADRVEEAIVQVARKTMTSWDYISRRDFEEEVRRLMTDLIAFHDDHGLLGWMERLPRRKRQTM